MRSLRRLVGAALLAAAVSLSVTSALAGNQEVGGVKSTAGLETSGIAYVDESQGAAVSTGGVTLDLRTEAIMYLLPYVP